MTTRPDLFGHAADGIAILLDEGDIRAAQRHVAVRNRRLGLPPAAGSVGVLVEDSYVLALRDAVRFPDGSLGTHNRVIYANRIGVGVLARFQGDLVLLRIYRHALGAWLLEIPRGAAEPGDDAEETARREIAEEIGGTVTHLTPLGRSVCDTSLSNSVLDLYLAELSAIGQPQLSEAIAAIIRVSPAEFGRMVLSGEIADCHAIIAFTKARMLGLLP